MAEFPQNYRKVLASEGGYHNGTINGKKDAGGETYRGLARKFHPLWDGWKVIDQLKAKITLEYGQDIPQVNTSHYDYAKKTFWTPFDLDHLKSQWIANIIFEILWGFPSTGPGKIKATAGVKATLKWVDVVKLLNKVNQNGIYAKLRELYAKMLRGSTNYTKWKNSYENRIASWPDEIPKILKQLFPVNPLAGTDEKKNKFVNGTLSHIAQNNGKDVNRSELRDWIKNLEPGNEALKSKIKKALSIMVTTGLYNAELTIDKKYFKQSLFGLDLDYNLEGLIDFHSPEDLNGLGITEALEGTGKANSFSDVARALIERIKEEGLFWHKPWSGHEPLNYFSKKPYTGLINRWATTGYGNGLFLTKNQVKKMGGTLKKGAKPFRIWFATTVVHGSKLKRGADGNPIKDHQGESVKINTVREYTGLISKFYTVYESIDISGIDFKIRSDDKIIRDIIKAEALVKGYIKSPPIEHRKGDAYYSPTEDKVVMPLKNSFDSSEDYYCVLFHELTHSTGHSKRLNRDIANKFGSNKYAREELVAELGANFLCSRCDIAFATVQSAAYLKGWAKGIVSESAKNPKFLISIMQDALRATNMIIGKTKGQKTQVKIKPAVTAVVKKRRISKPKPTVRTRKRKMSVVDYEHTLRDLAHNETLLEMYHAGWDDDIEKIVVDNVPLISTESAKRETGTKIGTKKDINPSKVSTKTKLSVEGAADRIWEDLSEQRQSTTSVEEIRDMIIDYLLSPTKKTAYQIKLEIKIKSLKDRLANATKKGTSLAGVGYEKELKALKAKFKKEYKKRHAKKNTNRRGLSSVLPGNGQSFDDNSDIEPANKGISKHQDIQPTEGTTGESQPANETKIFTGAQIAQKKYPTLDFQGKWKDAIGKPSDNFNMMIWGLPKNGKTHFSMQLAKYISRFGKVLYVASDEGEGETLQNKILEYDLDKNSFVNFVDFKQAKELETVLEQGKYKYVFIDLVSTTHGLTPELLRQYKTRYPGVGFMLVFSSTKDGNFKGDNAWAHFPDVLAEVKSGMANIKGRFGGGEYKIFND